MRRGIEPSRLMLKRATGRIKKSRSNMCGDDEDAGELEEMLYARFLVHARALLQPDDQTTAASRDDPLAYMDKLFSDALSRCVRDGEEALDFLPLLLDQLGMKVVAPPNH